MPNYRVTVHPEVKRYLRRHQGLKAKWNEIVVEILQSPERGPHIDHLKGDWHCSYRWKEGTYRIKYEVLEEFEEIHFYDAGTRGDIYKRGRGAGRRL